MYVEMLMWLCKGVWGGVCVCGGVSECVGMGGVYLCMGVCVWVCVCEGKCV